MPLERRATVIDSFSNAPEQIREVVNKYDKHLEHVGYTNDEDGSYYSKDDGIMMKEGISDDEYSSTFRHEYGHYIDDTMGELFQNVSDNSLFQCAYQIEKEHLYDNLGGLLNNLQMNDNVLESNYISDILSALSENDFDIKCFYLEKTCGFFGHDDEYWEERENAGRSETFANLFAIYAENNSDVVAFTEKWFPELSRQFKNSIEEMI